MNPNLYIEVPECLSPEQLKMMCELEIDAFGSDGSVDEYGIIAIVRNGRLIWLREEGDNRPVAVCELMRDYKQCDLAYIFGFYVRSDKQGRGYGRILMNHVFDLVRQDQFSEISLTVKPSNVAAVKLYERMGFRVAEIRKDE
ncbi:GNAT family N-acetyltransferase [Kyrpidia spormannii]|nr:GNAT family N-acetyltransferase [Kyrpidia spormannii]CAB3391596.1 GNAT family N-acetyltransferase [Kyrpidia spormannii]